MSADNGYVLRKNKAGKYVVQHYFASAEEYPDVEVAERVFDTLEEAVLAYEQLEHEMYPYTSEYGLSVQITERISDVEKQRQEA